MAFFYYSIYKKYISLWKVSIFVAVRYIESKPRHWHPVHNVLVKEIENLNKMKMALVVKHTMNHQDMGEKNNRRSELLFELKKIFEEQKIKYHLLPQEVHLSYAGSTAVPMAPGRL